MVDARKTYGLLVLFLVLVLVVFTAFSVGAVPFSLLSLLTGTASTLESTVFFDIRGPRVVLASFGAAPSRAVVLRGRQNGRRSCLSGRRLQAFSNRSQRVVQRRRDDDDARRRRALQRRQQQVGQQEMAEVVDAKFLLVAVGRHLAPLVAAEADAGVVD